MMEPGKINPRADIRPDMKNMTALEKNRLILDLEKTRKKIFDFVEKKGIEHGKTQRKLIEAEVEVSRLRGELEAILLAADWGATYRGEKENDPVTLHGVLTGISLMATKALNPEGEG